MVNPTTVTMASNKSVKATFNLIPPSADLVISLKGAPSLAASGSLVTYTVALTNTGPAAATTVRLTDTLSLSSTFESLISPVGWSCQAPNVGSTGQVVCTAGTLAAGAKASFTFTIQLQQGLPAGAIVTSTATVTSEQADPTTPNVANASTTIDVYRFYLMLIVR